MTTPVLNTGDGTEVELPFVEAVNGDNGYDISKLRAATGNVTLDEAFGNTASCRSEITFIDGEEGILRYRGYPIEQLAEQCSFVEVMWLVIYGELPTKEQVEKFEDELVHNMFLDERMRDLFRCFPRQSHPMPVLSAGICALSTFNRNHVGLGAEDVEIATRKLLAQVPTLAAYAYKNSKGQPFLYPKYDLSYVENFIRLAFGTPAEGYQFDESITQGLNALLVLHADHEQNCSTSTVRMVGSSQANLYVSVASGVNALSGPLHGGANQSVLEMLAAIRDQGIDPKDYLEQVKAKKAGIKLMGFGHRVYKNFDPRAAIIKKYADEILSKSPNGDKELLSIAKRLEEIALEDEYFVSRKLYPNVDFYSGLIYEAMGFPVEMFTVLFAVGRLPGWIAQWREHNADPKARISRPRQIYVGHDKRDVVPMDQR
ncbi:citrate synthase [Raineyella antarctica]|uniref:Citrate synthase n=1 Tax=Raineyella antarctica TaxID=1577474 RepID=A0A1G6GFZ4_9ACTN|nr:citrate synthase [Raineyella antarctica]SDB80942.1 citrate synthase [Raineyella antarctica]